MFSLPVCLHSTTGTRFIELTHRRRVTQVNNKRPREEPANQPNKAAAAASGIHSLDRLDTPAILPIDQLLHSLMILSLTADGAISDPLFKHTVVQEMTAEVDQFRQELEAETTKDRGTDRKVKALLDYAKQSGRTISENLWIPDPVFFMEFAMDTLVNVQVKDLTGYLRALNDCAKSLADSLPSGHPALPLLTANGNKPWHAEAFKKINKLYQQKLVARKHQESLLLGALDTTRLRSTPKGCGI